MPNITICGYESVRAEELKTSIDAVMIEMKLGDDAVTSIVAMKVESCDGKRSLKPYLLVRTTNEDEMHEIMLAFMDAGIREDMELDLIDRFVEGEKKP